MSLITLSARSNLFFEAKIAEFWAYNKMILAYANYLAAKIGEDAYGELDPNVDKQGDDYDTNEKSFGVMFHLSHC